MEAVLVPALVAAAVTLLIEYAAKPRLDARKDRIMLGHQQARTARAAVGRLAFQVGRYEAWGSSDAPWEARLTDIVDAARSEVDQLVDLLFQPAVRLSELELDAVEIVTKLGDFWTTAARTAGPSERLFTWLSNNLGEAVEVTEELLDAHPWERGKRRRLEAQIRELEKGPSRQAPERADRADNGE